MQDTPHSWFFVRLRAIVYNIFVGQVPKSTSKAYKDVLNGLSTLIYKTR